MSARTIHSYRPATTGKAIGLTIGLSYQVTVVLPESLLPSDRGRSYQVTVDKSVYPSGLRTSAWVPSLWQSWHCHQVIAVQVRDFGGRMTCRFVTGGRLWWSVMPCPSRSSRARS